MPSMKFYPIPKVGGPGPVDYPAARKNTSGDGKAIPFDQLLHRELQRTQEVKFSAHAVTRMEQRNIDMSQQDNQRLNNAVDLADKKGSKDSLVLIDDYALIVSVKNRTVVTAMDKEQLKDNVITKIDSTVLA